MPHRAHYFYEVTDIITDISPLQYTLLNICTGITFITGICNLQCRSFANMGIVSSGVD